MPLDGTPLAVSDEAIEAILGIRADEPDAEDLALTVAITGVRNVQFVYELTFIPVADAARIQEHLDGLLLVVRARTAPRDAILSTVDRLDEEKMLGIIFNAEIGARKRYKHYRYSGYAEAKPEPKRRKWRRREKKS